MASLTDACAHQDVGFVSGTAHCLECGMEMREQSRVICYEKEWSYAKSNSRNPRKAARSSCSQRRRSENTIDKDLRSLKLDGPTEELARTFYQKVTKGQTRRGNTRKGILFACALEACNLSGECVSIKSLSDKFGLSGKESTKGIKEVRRRLIQMSDQEVADIREMSGTDFSRALVGSNRGAEPVIQDILRRIYAPEEYIQGVLRFYESVKGRSSELNRARPSSVAAGVVFYYCRNNGHPMQIGDFCTKVKLSQNTVMSMYTEVAGLVAKSKAREKRRARPRERR